MKYSNFGNLPLPIAVWLASDSYTNENTISATSLLKSTRQIILSKRVPEETGLVDISSLVASRMGTAIHNAIETAWDNPEQALIDLGMPKVMDFLNINHYKEGEHNISFEVRSYKEINGLLVSGQFDCVMDGQLYDFKSTKTYAFNDEHKAQDYIMQGSIYRYLNQQLITEDSISIIFIFTDWTPGKLYEDNYPRAAVVEKHFPLLSIRDTEKFIKDKLNEIKMYADAPEAEIPYCNDKELWRTAPTYKYYKTIEAYEQGKRSTKNFTDISEANARMYQDGGTGIVVTVPGSVRACKYCPAFTVCSQKDYYIQSGELKL